MTGGYPYDVAMPMRLHPKPNFHPLRASILFTASVLALSKNVPLHRTVLELDENGFATVPVGAREITVRRRV